MLPHPWRSLVVCCLWLSGAWAGPSGLRLSLPALAFCAGLFCDCVSTCPALGLGLYGLVALSSFAGFCVLSIWAGASGLRFYLPALGFGFCALCAPCRGFGYAPTLRTLVPFCFVVSCVCAAASGLSFCASAPGCGFCAIGAPRRRSGLGHRVSTCTSSRSSVAAFCRFDFCSLSARCRCLGRAFGFCLACRGRCLSRLPYCTAGLAKGRIWRSGRREERLCSGVRCLGRFLRLRLGVGFALPCPWRMVSASDPLALFDGASGLRLCAPGLGFYTHGAPCPRLG